MPTAKQSLRRLVKYLLTTKKDDRPVTIAGRKVPSKGVLYVIEYAETSTPLYAGASRTAGLRRRGGFLWKFTVQ